MCVVRYEGNACVTQDGQFYTFSGGSLDPLLVPFTANNVFYSPNATFNYYGHSLSDLYVVTNHMECRGARGGVDVN
jgi:hypothetical protein